MFAGFWFSYKLYVAGEEVYTRQQKFCADERQEFIDELADKLAAISGDTRAEKFRNSIHDAMDHTEIKAAYIALLGC